MCRDKSASLTDAQVDDVLFVRKHGILTLDLLARCDGLQHRKLLDSLNKMALWGVIEKDMNSGGYARWWPLDATLEGDDIIKSSQQ